TDPARECTSRHRIDTARRHAAAHVYRQPIKRTALVSHHLARSLLPAWVRPASTNQMRADALDPARFDAGDATRKQAGCFDQLASHNPATAFFDQIRSGMHEETDVSCALILISVVASKPNIAQQTGQQRHVYLFVCGGGGVCAPTLLFCQLSELSVHIPPFAHAQG